VGKTEIAWTDWTWSPIVGCRRVSPGCEHCYAERLAATRLSGLDKYRGMSDFTFGSPRWTGQIRLVEKELEAPLRWRKPRKIFVCDMGDLFYEEVPDEWIDRVFAVMALAPWHTFQVLTKRAARMREYLSHPARGTSGGAIWYAAEKLRPSPSPNHWYHAPRGFSWPLPNVWIGVSVEDQQRADSRIPLLLQTSAAVRFISAEPLLGPIQLTGICSVPACFNALLPGRYPRLDWIIAGGESGPGARPCDLSWIRSIVEQCREARVPAFVKQLGAFPVTPNATDGLARVVQRGVPAYRSALALRDRKGGDPAEWPEDLRVREFLRQPGPTSQRDERAEAR